MMVRTVFVSLYLIVFHLVVNAQNTPLKKQDHVINKALNSFVADKDFKNASIGFYVIDTKSGEVVSEYNPKLSLMPASTQKVVTTATALEVLGKFYRFNTQLEYSGTIDSVNKVLKGNVYIRGGADPTLGSKFFNKNDKYGFITDWIKEIRKNNIEYIDGRIIADASRYSYEITPPKWAWEDVANYYGAGANGLTVFDDLYEVHFQSPNETDKLVSITGMEPEIPGLELNCEVLSSNKNADEAFIFGAPYNYQHVIRGTIPKGKKDFTIKGAIPDPAFYLAGLVKEQLLLSGIKVKDEATTIRLLQLNGDSLNEKRKIINIHHSPTITDIIYKTNKISVNLFAEHLFNEIGYKIKQEGSNSAGIEAIKDFWESKGMDMDGFYIFDGSGLSRSDAVTPEQMVFILNYMKNKSKYFDEFYNSLPVAGKSGTLWYIGKGTSAEGVVHAKSGSIGRVRAYVGYVTSKSGRELAFAMNVSNYNCADYAAQKKLSELMVAMADFNL